MYEKITLPSGIKLFLVPFEHSLSTTLLVYVGTGSRYETKEQNGLSHFLEHMVFKGSKKYPTSHDISKTIDVLGGDLNAATAKNYTAFIVRVAAEHNKQGVDLLADMLQHPKMQSKEIKKEATVILEEIKMYYDSPQRYVTQLYDQLLWGNTPLGRDIAGTPKTVQSFTNKDFLDYMQNLYTADNIIIGVGGKFDKNKIITQIEKNFHLFPQKKQIKPRRNTRKQTKPQSILHFRETEQTHMCLGFRALHNQHPDKYVLLLLETLLGGNMSSRLFIKIREELGLAYMIGTSMTQYFDVGAFTIHAGFHKQQTAVVIKAVIAILKELKKKRIAEKELQDAKSHLKGKLALSLDDPEGLTSWVCRQELILGNVKDVEEIIAGIDQVTTDNIQRLAKSIFINKGMNLALVGPIDEKQSFDSLLRV